MEWALTGAGLFNVISNDPESRIFFLSPGMQFGNNSDRHRGFLGMANDHGRDFTMVGRVPLGTANVPVLTTGRFHPGLYTT